MPNITQPGTYQAKVIDAGLSESTNGTPSVKIQFEIDSGQHIYWDGYLTDAAFERTVKTLQEVFSFTGDFDTVESFVGQLAQIVCREEEYNGETRIRVAFVNHKDGRRAMLEGDKKQSLVEKFSTRAKDLIEKESKADLPF